MPVGSGIVLPMPYSIRKRKGRKPWKIINTRTGRQVGSSTTKAKAKASARIRSRGER